MGGNLFTHAMSEAEVQAHEVCLKVKAASKRVGGSWLTHKASEAGSSTRSVFKSESGKV